MIGLVDIAEEPHAEVTLDGRVFAGKATAVPAEAPIQLDGPWECEYRPTMNNKWGDYRYPAADELIGPEAPRMKYRSEPAAGTSRPHWEAKELNDDDWKQVTCTFGPYWQVLDAVPARVDSAELRDKIVSAGIDGAAVIEIEGKALHWRPYTHSWVFGAEQADVHQAGTDGIGPVSPNFLVFDGVRGSQPMVRYLATRVFSPREQTLYLDFGGRDKLPPRQAWVNGELVVDIKDRPLPELNKVALHGGWNQVVLRVVQSGSRQLATFALFHPQPQTPDQPRFMPLSRWSDMASDLIYDSRPDGQESDGWYRFSAPPGAKERKIEFDRRVRRSLGRRSTGGGRRQYRSIRGVTKKYQRGVARSFASPPQTGLLRGCRISGASGI